MQWLVVEYKKTGFLFVVSREEREQYLKSFMELSGEIETKVVRVFMNKDAAWGYCEKINDVNNLINRM